MGKALYIAEKPSVAQEFARALKLDAVRRDGYLESPEAVVTWCLGHLITMSYPDQYDPRLKRWRLEDLPFLPDEFRYEVIPSSRKQFETVKKLLHRKDVEVIYVCTDSGREGEYIYRLVEQMAGVHGKRRLRVWIDSQTEEEIRRGIREAKDLSAYDHLAEAAYLRAEEDYLIGINFSRLLTLKYGNTLARLLHRKRTVFSVGRVMTCVLGMVVRREREIRNFVRTPFYRVVASVQTKGAAFEAEWKAVPGSRYWQHPALYKENGFRRKEDAQALITFLQEPGGAVWDASVVKREKKTQKKNPPLLFNLAELQNTCSQSMKIGPDETLQIAQDLYERKLITYPRTDARVLSTAVAKEIGKNVRGLTAIPGVRGFAQEILEEGRQKTVVRSRYTNDKQITDHYAIIPTGEGIEALSRLSDRHVKVYEKIVRRFLSIFYPPAVYERTMLELERSGEHFFAHFRVLTEKGYMKVTGEWKSRRDGKEDEPDLRDDEALREALSRLRKGSPVSLTGFSVREGETSPPKRYTSGSMILAMENAGSLIEDEELRAQIRGSGIGTSATRADILKKLAADEYLSVSKKTQVLTPTLMGELICDTVNVSIRSLLNPELTASWEKGLTQVAEGTITQEMYREKLRDYIIRRTSAVLSRDESALLQQSYAEISGFYKKGKE